VPEKLFAYWRLDESKKDLVYKDSSAFALSFDPSPLKI
jgi:hypothetical protein